LVIQWYGVVPVSALNLRANVRGDMAARRARASTLRSASRWPAIHSSTGCSVSAVTTGTGVWMNWACPPSRCGATTIRRATVEATAALYSLRIRCRHASSPAADPAEVMIGSSSTYSTSHRTFAAGKRASSSST
jgi:hypothetical protein